MVALRSPLLGIASHDKKELALSNRSASPGFGARFRRPMANRTLGNSSARPLRGSRDCARVGALVSSCFGEFPMNFDQLIRFAAEQGASDIHLQTNAAPLLRINGLIRSVESPPVTAEMLFQFINSLRPNLPVEAIKEAMVAGLDFSHAIPGVSR